MATSSRLRHAGALAALLLVFAAPVQAIAPQANSGTYLEIQTESSGQATIMKLSLADNALRMDAASPQGDVSVVSIGGDDGKMIIMMHAQKQYMEMTAEMMAGMAGMMGQMPAEVEEETDTTPPTFTRTGNTKQVGDWSAYEVLVEHPDDADGTIMWFSEDVDADFRGLAEQVMSSLSSLLNSPMMRMGGGGGGGSGVFDDIEAQLAAVDIPDGFPVQIINGTGGDQTINTLRAINQSASFDATTWQAPEGYSKMSMPFGR